ncbi:MAG: alkaline phosphatase family protein [Candidatus Eisenbacteria bacterium]|nr:alkaline phosphatase family protein [Candidatus Eisenbacteria bacterium]
MNRRGRAERSPRAAARLAALVLMACLAAALGCSRSGTPVERRVIVVGIDALDWGVTQRLMQEGKLPNLSRIAQSGVSCPLRTLEPFEKSPVIWTTIATGKHPENHGIRDALAPDGKSLMTSNVRTARTLWDILGEHGFSVGVVGWYVTWPAEPVNGYLVSDYFCFVPRDGRPFPERLVYPDALLAEIDSLRVVADDVPDALVRRLADPDRALTEREATRLPLAERFPEMRALSELPTELRKLRDHAAGDETYLGVSRHLMRTHPTRFFAVYLRGLDSISHTFWAAAHPADAGFAVSRTERLVFGETVERYYRRADEMLGELLADFGNDATVLVCSDHGFRGPGPGRPQGGINDHAPLGVLFLSGEGVRQGEVLDERGVSDVTPTVLALSGLPIGRDMDGAAIEEAMTPEFLRRHPVRFVPTHERER